MKKPTTAEQRGQQLLTIKIKDLPPLAKAFALHLGMKVGMCLEVCLHAYTVYAQCVENLPCTDDTYLASPDDMQWFAERTQSV